MLGAWLGAIPIPLDWDRDWQVSPKSSDKSEERNGQLQLSSEHTSDTLLD